MPPVTGSPQDSAAGVVRPGAGPTGVASGAGVAAGGAEAVGGAGVAPCVPAVPRGAGAPALA
ncbi:hypothetical protein ACWGOK_08555 [Streptomyces eurythermus]